MTLILTLPHLLSIFNAFWNNLERDFIITESVFALLVNNVRNKNGYFEREPRSSNKRSRVEILDLQYDNALDVCSTNDIFFESGSPKKGLLSPAFKIIRAYNRKSYLDTTYQCEALFSMDLDLQMPIFMTSYK